MTIENVNPPKLIFVYNANAGLAAGLMDSVHKLVSPGTYPCSLCAVTYGLTRMDPRWKAWLRALPVEAVFHHRPDFRAAYPAAAGWPLPLVALEQGGQLRPLLDATTLDTLASLDALVAALEVLLPDHGIAPSRANTAAS